MKKVNLYRVSMAHIKTDEKATLEVCAENVDEATNKCSFLFAYGRRYRWTGSGPVYDENGEIPSKEVTSTGKHGPEDAKLDAPGETGASN